MAPKIEGVKARRIALVSDTHFMKPKAQDVPKALLRALDDVDLIVHLGHISSPASLEVLEKVAPVIALQTPLDDRIMGDALAVEQESGRTKGTNRVLQAGGLLVGLVHNLAADKPEISVTEASEMKFPRKSVTELLKLRFGRRVDVVAFANTHAPIVAFRDGVLFVNPGSPNLPMEGTKPSIAVLALAGGTAHVEIRDVRTR